MLLTDPNSSSNFNSFLTSHLHLNLSIDFDNQILVGFVDVSFRRIEEKCEVIVLDVANLNVKAVSFNNDSIPVKFIIFLIIYLMIVYLFIIVCL